MRGPLRDDMTPEQAGDILYALASPQLWNLLALDRSWSAEQLERFLGDALTRLLLPPHAESPAHHPEDPEHHPAST